MATCAATPMAFAAANLYAANLASIPGEPILNMTGAAATLPAYLAAGGGLSADPAALCSGLLGACGVWLVYSRHLINSGTRRDGEEHGSARWATKREMRAFEDRGNEWNNIILTQRCKAALIPRKFDLKTDRNKNVLVIGGSGSGKTRYYVKPNIMQANCSYFVTDPKGTLSADLGGMLESLGYRIRQFSTVDFQASSHYNPLHYVKSEADIITFAECLIRNTTGDEEHKGDPFWENAERLLYMALTSYLLTHCPEPDRNLEGLLTLLSLAEARDEDESFKSPLDMLFDEVETGMKLVRVAEPQGYDEESRAFDDGAGSFAWVMTGHPTSPDDDFALSNYRAFKTAAGKTLKSIIISCNVRLKPLSVAEVRSVLRDDELQLDRMGNPGCRTIIFASMSDTNPTFDFLHAMLMWQAVDVLCTTALARHGGSLPTHVHFILDEFANIGCLPNFDRTISVVRSRNISCSVILQSTAQLAANYSEKQAQVIMDNCDFTLFLGGKSKDTNAEISESLGKQTISTVTLNETRGQGSSTTKNRQRQERDLMQASEVGKLPRDQAIVLIAGANPVRDRKYRLDGHPRYGMTAPEHAKPFDFKAYMEKERKETA